jgi:hypothetical protein
MPAAMTADEACIQPLLMRIFRSRSVRCENALYESRNIPEVAFMPTPKYKEQVHTPGYVMAAQVS